MLINRLVSQTYLIQDLLIQAPQRKIFLGEQDFEKQGTIYSYKHQIQLSKSNKAQNDFRF